MAKITATTFSREDPELYLTLPPGAPSRQQLYFTGIQTMSAAGHTTLHTFMVFAPDYADEGALQRRLKVREQHLANAKELHASGFTSAHHA
jgi:hypothetical protein